MAETYVETVTWRGEQVQTLAELWPDQPRAMIVGINPAPTSVAAGHYYQGAAGTRQIGRLIDAGLFPRPAGHHFEEAALGAGVGFADLVRRPTVGAGELPAAELAHGRADLIARLRESAVPLVVCVFAPPADAIMGAKTRAGLQRRATPWGGQLFRMPGPYAPVQEAATVMEELRAFLAS